MFMKKKNRSPGMNRSGSRSAAAASASETITKAALLAFFGGVILCTALLALFAALLANTPLPLTLVRPLACAAASAGAALSGFLLARKLKKQMLLCGLGSGVFWAACQSVAAIAMNGQDLLQGGNLMLPIALLLGGILGGALAAVWAVR